MKKMLRNVLLLCATMCVKVLWIFPLNKRQILFMSFGGQFSDSPKYIFEYIYKRKGSYEYIWVSNKENQGIPKECKIIKGKGIKYLYYMVTSKLIITNDFVSTYYPRRKNQTIINTWHGGSPLKTVGMVGTEISNVERDFFQRHDKIYSFFLSSSKFMTQEVFRKSFGYTGKIYETGMPRNAILLREHCIQEKKVRDYYGIDSNKKIVLYAPTFRGSSQQGGFLPDENQFDVNKCLEALKERFSDEFCFIFRAHHACNISINSKNVYMASDYPDMQELLCASDVLISDYSSCMGDEALMYKPVFLYCPDLDEYIKERGFYWDIYSLPFPVFVDEKELINGIKNFDYDKYITNVDDYLLRLGTFENPSADSKVGEMVIKLMDGSEIID